MSSNKVPQSSDVPAAGTDAGRSITHWYRLLLSRQGNDDDEVGWREVPVVPIAEVSVVIAAEAASHRSGTTTGGVVATSITSDVVGNADVAAAAARRNERTGQPS